MANTSLDKVTGRVLLENGTDPAGNIVTVNVSLGNLSEEYYQTSEANAKDKLLAVVAALSPCLAKTISSVQVVETATITN